MSLESYREEQALMRAQVEAMGLRSDAIIIERSQLDDWLKLLLKHPEPVWPGDVTSNKALELLKERGLVQLNGEAWWTLTELATDAVLGDRIVFVKPREAP